MLYQKVEKQEVFNFQILSVIREALLEIPSELRHNFYHVFRDKSSDFYVFVKGKLALLIIVLRLLSQDPVCQNLAKFAHVVKCDIILSCLKDLGSLRGRKTRQEL